MRRNQVPGYAWRMTLLPTRTIPLTGASTFRDLGGYVGADGRALRWRTLFRSDHLAGLTAQDQAQLLDLGLAQVLDLDRLLILVMVMLRTMQ